MQLPSGVAHSGAGARTHGWRASAADAVLARSSAVPAPPALLSVGLGQKLLACPALVTAVLWLQGAGADATARVSLIESAMPPMIGAGITAAQAPTRRAAGVEHDRHRHPARPGDGAAAVPVPGAMGVGRDG